MKTIKIGLSGWCFTFLLEEASARGPTIACIVWFLHEKFTDFVWLGSVGSVVLCPAQKDENTEEQTKDHFYKFLPNQSKPDGIAEKFLIYLSDFCFRVKMTWKDDSMN